MCHVLCAIGCRVLQDFLDALHRQVLAEMRCRSREMPDQCVEVALIEQHQGGVRVLEDGVETSQPLVFRFGFGNGDLDGDGYAACHQAAHEGRVEGAVIVGGKQDA